MADRPGSIHEVHKAQAYSYMALYVIHGEVATFHVTAYSLDEALLKLAVHIKATNIKVISSEEYMAIVGDYELKPRLPEVQFVRKY